MKTLKKFQEALFLLFNNDPALDSDENAVKEKIRNKFQDLETENLLCGLFSYVKKWNW